MEIDKVREIIAEQFNIPIKDITDEMSFVEDLSADSLDIFQLVTALEEEFDIEISNDDAEKIKTVGDISKFIKENFD